MSYNEEFYESQLEAIADALKMIMHPEEWGDFSRALDIIKGCIDAYWIFKHQKKFKI